MLNNPNAFSDELFQNNVANIYQLNEPGQKEISQFVIDIDSAIADAKSPTFHTNDAYRNFLNVILNGPGHALQGKKPELSETEHRIAKNLKLLAKIIAAGGIGCAAGIFYWSSAKEAVATLAKVFNFEGTPLEAFLSWYMPIVGAFENSALGAYSVKNMIDEFTQPVSEEVAFLTGWRKANSWHTARTRGKKGADLFFAAAPVIATLAISMHSGGNITLNIISAIANYAPNWIGVSKFDYLPQKQTPNKLAREALANYIGQSLQTFLQRDYHSCIAPKLAALKCLLEGQDSEKNANALFLEILNLSYIESVDGEIAKPAVLALEQETQVRAAFRKTVTGISTAAAGGYVIAAGDGAGIFLPQNPQAAAIPVALLAILPFFGLSYISGKEVGATLFSGQKTLVDVSISSEMWRNIYNGIKYLMGIASIGSSGTNILTNYLYMRFGALPDDINELIAKIMAAVGGIGAPIVNGYYTLLLLDALVIAYNQQYGDEGTQTLINFVLEQRKLQSTILNSTPENFESYIKAMCEQGELVKVQLKKAFKHKAQVNGKKVSTYYEESPKDFSAPGTMLDHFGIIKDELVDFLKKDPNACFYLGSEIFEVLVSGRFEAPERLEKLSVIYAKCLQDTIVLAAQVIDRFKIMDINKHATDELFLRIKKFGLSQGEKVVQAFLEKKKELAEIEAILGGECHDKEIMHWYIDLIQHNKFIEPGWRVLRSYAEAHNIALNIWEAKNTEERSLSLITKKADDNKQDKEFNILLLNDGLKFTILEQFIPEASKALQLRDILEAIFKERIPAFYKDFFKKMGIETKTDYYYLPNLDHNQSKFKSIYAGCLRFRNNASAFANRDNSERQPLMEAHPSVNGLKT